MSKGGYGDGEGKARREVRADMITAFMGFGIRFLFTVSLSIRCCMYWIKLVDGRPSMCINILSALESRQYTLGGAPRSGPGS